MFGKSSFGALGVESPTVRPLFFIHSCSLPYIIVASGDQWAQASGSCPGWIKQKTFGVYCCYLSTFRGGE